jgi:hypothetical protein
MENFPWQRRARAAGLPQRLLAWIAGLQPHTVSQGLRGKWKSGVPEHLKSLIIAWELMAPDQRKAWQAEIDAERQRVANEGQPETK